MIPLRPAPPPPEMTPELSRYLRRREAVNIAASARIAKTPDELIALSERIASYVRGEE